MPRLHVNIDHAATLRQARLSHEPNPIAIARMAELAGASGITAHLREDRRHIQDDDVRLLRKEVQSTFNLEMAGTPEMVQIALAIKPDQVCLVPEKRQELTTEGGLNLIGQEERLQKQIPQLQKAGIDVSLFIDPHPKQIELAEKLNTNFIEIHTGTYANSTNDKEKELEKISEATSYAHSLGLRVNAGHGLDYTNVIPILKLEHIEELNIGYAILCRSIYVGISQAVEEMYRLF